MANLSLLLLVLFATLFPHAFVEYSINIYVYSAHQSLSELLIEDVVNVFPNDTFSYNVTVFVLNFSEIFPSSINYDNLSCPRNFLYIPNAKNSIIQRNIVLTLTNESEGYYIYKGVSYMGYNEFDWYYFVNDSGVPSKIILVQKNEYGQPVSITTYTLVRSNLINGEEEPIIPAGFKLVNGASVSSGLSDNLDTALNSSMGGDIFFSILVLIPVLVGVKYYVDKRKKVYPSD
ncbi:hypothetical protein V6M85_05685 [Sulfolobus tengchongensis]|uniref:Uncharacterized protein n=1 Tax=Sulfolobus tengchongensis TaxID=207809 RepID=A0AAX4L5P9_9CREN